MKDHVWGNMRIEQETKTQDAYDLMSTVPWIVGIGLDWASFLEFVFSF